MRRCALLIGAVLVSASCEPIADQEPIVPGSEAIPGPGYFHVTADPPQAQQQVIVLRHFGSDGVESQMHDSFAPGTTIVFDGIGFTGPRGLSVNGTDCAGRFHVQENRVTDVLLHVDGTDCQVETIGIRPVEEPHP